jgi:hypothetical protein
VAMIDQPVTTRSLFLRIWPITVVALSLIATVTWTGIIGYGIFRLTALAF